MLGLECASIFAIFTSQAWNMTFSMYHSLITQPTELDEAARMFRLTKWERFWRLDVPSSMIGLVWNGMMSFGRRLVLPGRLRGHQRGQQDLHAAGDRLATYKAAVDKGDLSEVGIGIVVMIVLVVGVNVLFWRPLWLMPRSSGSRRPKPPNNPRATCSTSCASPTCPATSPGR